MCVSWIVLRTRLPGRYVIDSIAMMPHAVPRIAFAFSVLLLMVFLGRRIPFLYGSLGAIMFANIISHLSFGTRAINSTLVQIHRDLEDAVQTCGGSRITALRRVLMPLIAPTLFYVFLWTVLITYREVTMALFLQSPRSTVLSVAIWQRWQTLDPTTAAALGVIMVGCMAIIIGGILRAFPRLIYIGARRLS